MFAKCANFANIAEWAGAAISPQDVTSVVSKLQVGA
jgi:hypothetical protein